MKSMTGFGRGQSAGHGWRYTVEMAAVNRKQCDIVISLPREWQELESRLRQSIAERISRGRINVTLRVERAGPAPASVRLDSAVARRYIAVLGELENLLKRPLEVGAADLLRAPGVITFDESEPAAPDAWPHIESATRRASDALDRSRLAEGRTLQRELRARHSTLMRIHRRLATLAPRVTIRYRESLGRRLADAGLTVALDDERLVKEIALFADRCDISEELARFASHLGQFAVALKQRDPAGRSMDFLCQELHRELNTIGSKANDAAISHLVVEGKTEVEKLREQVQNVE
jgi:uncharacterized protein (TIGR00255 family)